MRADGQATAAGVSHIVLVDDSAEDGHWKLDRSSVRTLAAVLRDGSEDDRRSLANRIETRLGSALRYEDPDTATGLDAERHANRAQGLAARLVSMGPGASNRLGYARVLASGIVWELERAELIRWGRQL